MSQVSVIIPVYNAGGKLHQCLRSVLRQTVAAIEVILVNDGSTDDSRAICAEYASKDSRVRFVEQARSGSIAARRKGAELATSPYIAFVDADDWLDEAMLDRLLGIADVHGADIAVCNTYRVLDSSAWIKRSNTSSYFRQQTVYRGEDIKAGLVPSFLHGHAFPAYLHGKLYRRELVLSCGTYLEPFTFFGDDLYYNLEMFLQASTVVVIPEPLYYYRAGGLTSRYMPELVQDAVAGYRVQRMVINAHYPEDEREAHLIGINLMLLNTLRTYLKNLYLSKLTQEERRSSIAAMCRLPEVIGSVNHEPSARRIRLRFVNAVRKGDIAYLDREGRRQFRKSLLRNWMIVTLSTFDSKKFDKLRSNLSNSGDTKRQHLRSR
ncbi:glycosyltransferase family 2 protein [Paenibacillus sp. LHD-117]|uniref:glycosyltransferase family 2 protein n=1 Tax=Paenibacillus sp. LHD-117 TaxID=3071412 RepID=UPI0027DF8A62|nr:glycosyltransferase family 2 protein [Paenibacillus sp. LHD-117]MDQ6422376.1 glycosyltransferase family 2 protein [Paenibacillus sp. LHD-117]